MCYDKKKDQEEESTMRKRQRRTQTTLFFLIAYEVGAVNPNLDIFDVRKNG